MFKKDKSSLLFTIGAATLLIGLGILAYSIVISRGPAKDLPAGAVVVPQDAMMALSITTDESQWNRLREFGTPESKASFERFLSELRDRLLTSNGYAYQQDIQPWVGNTVMVAFLRNKTAIPVPPRAPNAPPPQPIQQSVAIILPISNPIKAKELLAKPRPLNQGKMVERNYKGVQVTETQGIPDRNFSVAVLGTNYLAVTTDPTATDRIIDTYKGEPSLAKTPGYGDAIQQIKDVGAFGQIYVNMPVAAAFTAANSSREISVENLEKLQQNQGFATTATLDADGIGFKSISWLKPDSTTRIAVENNALKMANRLPNNTIMMVSGGNLQRLWQDYVLGADANPLAPINPQVLRTGLKSTTGQDLDKDFINWMAGEFSLSLIPAPAQNPKDKFAAGFVFMVETNNRGAANKSLKQLDEMMKTKGFRVEEIQVGGQPATQWKSPFGGITVTRGWMKDVLFITVGAPVVDAIVPAPTSPLLSSELFQKTVRSQLKPHNGNFFIDTESAFNPKNLALPEFPPNQKIWIDATRSIGITAAVIGDRTTRYDAFVGLKKSDQSTPSPKPSPNPSSPSSPSPSSSSPSSPSPSSPSPSSPSPSSPSPSSSSPSPDSPSPSPTVQTSPN
ncbi:MAG: DUF3352 domain-containing protein [Microcoleus sp. PH2017_15_JOR_U_A]|uniref:DUF3352 domain-containing protein n=1 Tax=Microcoleus sp. PH2017_15_JOR_U_A TaxID=2798826 RepID=UPI001D622648|nr:DUF3352 domain-containing protein [Microcoleus sp. PH2017_15_JOR_U_A]MCC3500379.1 DUF3352 domain-containing protein [Microcoleus sp. PH2017_15_JOR_U_A]